MDNVKFVFLAIFLCILINGGCHYFNQKMHLDDDNLAEELIEDIIEDKLGLPEDSLDLTP